MRYGGHILDGGDGQSGGLQGSDGRVSSRTRTFYQHIDFFQSQFDSCLSSIFGSLGRGKGGIFPGAFKAHFTGAGPTNHISIIVGESDDGIIKAGFNMRNPQGFDFDFLFGFFLFRIRHSVTQYIKLSIVRLTVQPMPG